MKAVFQSRLFTVFIYIKVETETVCVNLFQIDRTGRKPDQRWKGAGSDFFL